MLRESKIEREIFGDGSEGTLLLGDVFQRLDALLATHAGQIKLIYMDPPYLTGEHFSMRVHVGAAEWKSGKSSLQLPTFYDDGNRDEFLSLMRGVLTRCRMLLRDDGMLFLHIDYRTHPYLRLLMDEIFGEENFLNEIIWAYQTGGRSFRHFSRKHDVILFYRKSAHDDFNIHAIMAPPAQPRSNHMRRHVDPDGRVYRSIRSNGRVYTYYDDDPVAPSDVWSDLSHLQQKDPERTGYDTQKPLSLLERIVKCGSREGEIVLDPFCGSATTLEAAQLNRRKFIGIDACPLVANIARRRLNGANYTLTRPAGVGAVSCEATAATGVGFYHVSLKRFSVEENFCNRSFSDLDAVDNWSVGYLRDGAYYVQSLSARRRREPEILNTLDAPMYAGQLAVCVSDVSGRSFCYEIDPE